MACHRNGPLNSDGFLLTLGLMVGAITLAVRLQGKEVESRAGVLE